MSEPVMNAAFHPCNMCYVIHAADDYDYDPARSAEG